MSFFTLGLSSAPETLSVANAMAELFRLTPQLVLGSVVAGYSTIWLYDRLKSSLGLSKLWLRNLTSVAPSQLLDSILFFTIAFYGTVPNESLIQIIIGGALVKILIDILSTPFLYWSYPAPKQFWT